MCPSWSASSGATVIAREKQVQLSVFGKGGLVRQVLLPSPASRNLLALRGDRRGE